jgi:hypothetical protein
MPLRNIGGVSSTTVNVLAGLPVCQYVIVGGGGNGGSGYAGYGAAGGGGGGVISGSGFIPVIGSTYGIVVGAGGGNNSSIANSLIAIGGGVGGQGGAGSPTAGNGGCGGGSSWNSSSNTPGTGTAGQGFPGGYYLSTYIGGGGGGAGGSGQPGVFGGLPRFVNIAGFSTSFSAGGLGGAVNNYSVVPNPAVANTGNGGDSNANYNSSAGGTGGSGIVMLAHSTQYNPAVSTTGSPYIGVINGYRIYIWTSTGSITF